MQASFPQSIASWTDRINGEIIWAADPNSLAAEIIAIETAIGVNPQIEYSPPFGPPVTYASESAKISAWGLGLNNPYISLELDTFNVQWQQSSEPNGVDFQIQHPPFRVKYDTHGYFDGTCMTVRATGLYLITQHQQWEYRPRGWCRSCCWVNGNRRRQDIFHYDSFPQGSDYYGQTYNGEYGETETAHFEHLVAGDTVRLTLGNATDVQQLQCVSSTFEAYFLRNL
jgi:hypothetical protein